MIANLQTIHLPEFRYSPENKSSAEKQSLNEWQIETRRVVDQLREVLRCADLQLLATDELAHVYSILQSLSTPGEFTNQDLVTVAAETSKQLPSPNLDVVKSTLLHHIKPLFAQVPHTLIDPSSGRSLHRPAGGPSGSLDFYEGQDWKRRPGLSYLIIWCIQFLKSDEFAQVWHLIVPSSMTFLDDYESYYKLKGIEIISCFIDRAPAELLKRTGIDGLIKKSLNAALLHLHTPASPKIIQLSVPALIRLIKSTCSPGSRQRFDQLCALLGNGIISSIWVFAYQDLDTIEVSLLMSCVVVEELGIGAVRYLKPMLQQVVQYLSSDAGPYVVQLQLAALKLLKVVLMTCRPRIHEYNTIILDGILRCWVCLQERNKMPCNQELVSLLREVVNDLITIVPSVHYQSIIALDEQIFAPLFHDGVAA